MRTSMGFRKENEATYIKCGRIVGEKKLLDVGGKRRESKGAKNLKSPWGESIGARG